MSSPHQSLVDEIATVADRHGVLWVYFPDSRKVQGHKGSPDLLLCGTHHMILREVKTYGDRMRPDQVRWKYQLLSAGADMNVWTPRDLENGRVEQEIRQLNAIAL